MNPETKAICEHELVVETCRNWKSAIVELSEACRHIEGAVLLLIRRMAGQSHLTPAQTSAIVLNIKGESE